MNLAATDGQAYGRVLDMPNEADPGKQPECPRIRRDRGLGSSRRRGLRSLSVPRSDPQMLGKTGCTLLLLALLLVLST